MPIQFSDADRSRYDTFLGQHFRGFLRAPPKLLWHYTSGSSLVAIVESGTLWATQVACMNDHMEFEYAVGLLREAFQEKRATTPPSSDETCLYDRVAAGLAHGYGATSEWFVACLSEAPDDLSQWRAYGGGEGGCAIGFDGPSIAKCGLSDQCFLVPVSYDRGVHTALCRAVADATVQFFNEGLATYGAAAGEWADAFLAVWREMVIYLAPILKHDGFAAEREWRIVRRLRETDRAKMKYRQKQTMLSRHLPLAFPPPGKPGSKLLPINKVCVGPSRHKEVSKVGSGICS
jgi:hypothetical protein